MIKVKQMRKTKTPQGPDEEEAYYDNPMHPDCIAAIVQPVQQCAQQ